MFLGIGTLQISVPRNPQRVHTTSVCHFIEDKHGVVGVMKKAQMVGNGVEQTQAKHEYRCKGFVILANPALKLLPQGSHDRNLLFVTMWL